MGNGSAGIQIGAHMCSHGMQGEDLATRPLCQVQVWYFYFHDNIKEHVHNGGWTLWLMDAGMGLRMRKVPLSWGVVFLLLLPLMDKGGDWGANIPVLMQDLGKGDDNPGSESIVNLRDLYNPLLTPSIFCISPMEKPYRCKNICALLG